MANTKYRYKVLSASSADRLTARINAHAKIWELVPGQSVAVVGYPAEYVQGGEVMDAVWSYTVIMRTLG